MLQRRERDRTEFIALSLRGSVEAIRAFASDDIDVAVLYTDDEPYLIGGASSGKHHDVIARADPVAGPAKFRHPPALDPEDATGRSSEVAPEHRNRRPMGWVGSSPVTSTTEDRLAIHELVALQGHLFDAGALDRLDELFTDDVAYDVEDLGGGLLRGIAAIREAAQTLGDQNPLGHHTTNVIVAELGSDRARVHSKGLVS